MAQTGSEVAQSLLNTWHRSEYSAGNPVRSAIRTCNTGDTGPEEAATRHDKTNSKLIQY